MTTQGGELRAECGNWRLASAARSRMAMALLALSIALLGGNRAAWAASAPDELLKLVPSDVGLCVEFRDLEHELPRIHNSRIAERFRETPIYRAWTSSRQHEQLVRVSAAIEKGTGQPVPELARQLFGRELVLALLQPPGRPATGVLLTRASSGEFLQKAVGLWNALDGKEASAREYAGQTYFSASRPERSKRPPETVYYLVRDDILALSDNEPMIRRVAALARAIGKEPGQQPGRENQESSLAESSLYREARADLPQQCLASIFLNPRAWDGMLGIERAAEADDVGARLIAQVWRGCRSLMVGLRAQDGLIVDVVASVDSQRAGTGWERLVAQSSGAADFVGRVPADALGVMTGRGTFGEFATLVASLIRPQDSQAMQRTRQVARGLALGRDPLSEGLQLLHGNWGIYLQASAPKAEGADTEQLPIQAVAAWELPETSDAVEQRGGPSLRKALENAVEFGLNLWAADRNSKRGEPLTVIRSAAHGSVQVRWLEGLGVASPAYAFVERYFVVATTPKVLEQFVKRNAAQSLLQFSEYKRLSEAHFPGASHVMYVNLAALRHTLSEQRPTITAQLARIGNATVEQVESRLERLDPLLNLVDGAFATATLKADRLRLVFGALGDE